MSFEIPDVWAYVETRWPGKSTFVQVAKVCEEAGEAMGAAIKASENRPTADPLHCELADTILAAIAALQSMALNPAQVVGDRWAEVSQRGQAPASGADE